MYENNHTRQKHTEYTYVDGIGFAPSAPAITERQIIKEYANGIGIVLLLYLLLSRLIPFFLAKALSFFIPALSIFGRNIAGSQVVFSIIGTVSYVLTLSLPFLFYVLVYHIPTRIIFPFSKVKKVDTMLMVFIGLGVSTIGMYSSAAVSTVFSVFGIIPTAPDISFGSNIFRTLLLIVEICIIAPILEELVFRGIIMQSLRRFGDRFALVMSAIIFALIHLNFVQFPNALLMGLVMGYFVLRTNSLHVGIFMHAANNILSVLITIASEYIDIRYSSLTMNIVCGVYLVAGIVSFLVITKKYKNIFYISGSASQFSNNTKFLWFVSAMPMLFSLIIMCSIMLGTLIFS
ncbi:MAG: type II CAAX endopeptidase family protein [Oscillospiraceae bacterium]